MLSHRHTHTYTCTYTGNPRNDWGNLFFSRYHYSQDTSPALIRMLSCFLFSRVEISWARLYLMATSGSWVWQIRDQYCGQFPYPENGVIIVTCHIGMLWKWTYQWKRWLSSWHPLRTQRQASWPYAVFYSKDHSTAWTTQRCWGWLKGHGSL